jgi:putative FmdB family regulatory protein
MPIYEFRCSDCGKHINVLMGFKDLESTFHCPECKSTKLKRLFSRFASPKSEEARMESMADPAKWTGFDENDPKAMMKFMKKMGKELGEERGEDFDQMMDEAEQEAYRSGTAGASGDDLYTPGDLS